MGMCKPSDTFALTETHPTTVGLDTRYEGKLPHEFTSDDLSSLFHMPINDASAKLGICSTLLKKLCRKNGVTRWPHRKVKSIQLLIEQSEQQLALHPEDLSTQQQLYELKQKLQVLLQNPNMKYSDLVSKQARKPAPTDKPLKTIKKERVAAKLHPIKKEVKVMKVRKTQPTDLTRCTDEELYNVLLSSTPFTSFSRISFVGA